MPEKFSTAGAARSRRCRGGRGPGGLRVSGWRHRLRRERRPRRSSRRDAAGDGVPRPGRRRAQAGRNRHRPGRPVRAHDLLAGSGGSRQDPVHRQLPELLVPGVRRTRDVAALAGRRERRSAPSTGRTAAGPSSPTTAGRSTRSGSIRLPARHTATTSATGSAAPPSPGMPSRLPVSLERRRGRSPRAATRTRPAASPVTEALGGPDRQPGRRGEDR